MFGNGVEDPKNILKKWKYYTVEFIVSMENYSMLQFFRSDHEYVQKVNVSQSFNHNCVHNKNVGSNSNTYGLSLILIIFYHIFLWSSILRNLLLYIYIYTSSSIYCLHFYWTLSINFYFTHNKFLLVNPPLSLM